MKKVLLIMAAALMTMTQCRKQETMPVTPSANTIKMTITAGSGRTGINTETGAITWSKDDKLYVSDGAKWLGSLTLVGDGGSAQGTFTGSIAGIDESETTCHFFYLGHDNGMEEPAAGTCDNVGISFAAQGGTLDGAMKYHLGHGTTAVTVTEGGYEGYVLMNTKIAIAHINFTTDGTQAYTGSLTMGGTGISNTLSVNPGGTFTGSGTDGITIDNGDGITGERYVTLIPTETADVLNVAFTGDATGSMTFLAGIHENKFYGMKDAIAVTLEASAPKFTVGMDGDKPITVEFSKGNLWYGIAAGESAPAFHFEENQWDYSIGEWDDWWYNWNASHVSHFYWSATESVACAQDYSDESASTSDVFFTNSSSFQVAGETAGTWRTLSRAEWIYLLGFDPEGWEQTEEYGRPHAKSLSAWKELDGGTHKGFVILPDGTENPSTVMGGITSTADLASSGAVFLPATGYRNGVNVIGAGSSDIYWFGTPYEYDKGRAYYVGFSSSTVRVYNGTRGDGSSVRLVR